MSRAHETQQAVEREAARRGIEPGRIVALAQQIEALSPPDRLRLAADLLDKKRPAEALSMAKRVVDELTVVLATLPRRRSP